MGVSVSLVALVVAVAIFALAVLITPRDKWSHLANLTFFAMALATVGGLSLGEFGLDAYLLAFVVEYFAVLYLFQPRRRIPDVAALVLFAVFVFILYQNVAPLWR